MGDKEIWPKRDMQADDCGLGKSPVAIDLLGATHQPFHEIGPTTTAERNVFPLRPTPP
ncbi:MAG: hypothetical protein N2C14_07905 [Planctomycetales bacterium]